VSGGEGGTPLAAPQVSPTEPSPPPSEPTPPLHAAAEHEPALTGPLLAWLGLQLLALFVALARVPLAAGYPRPAELLAAQVMAVTQVTGAALLFPWLMRTSASAIVVVATTWPFLALAGSVSGVPPMRLIGVGSHVTAWMIAGWAWALWAPARSRPAAVAAAALITLGSLALFYLWLEFGPNPALDVGEAAGRWAAFTPPLAALRQLHAAPDAREYGIPAAVAAGACLCQFWAPRTSQVIHNS